MMPNMGFFLTLPPTPSKKQAWGSVSLKGRCCFQMGAWPPGLLVCSEWKNLSLAAMAVCEAMLPPHHHGAHCLSPAEEIARLPAKVAGPDWCGYAPCVICTAWELCNPKVYFRSLSPKSQTEEKAGDGNQSCGKLSGV